MLGHSILPHHHHSSLEFATTPLKADFAAPHHHHNEGEHSHDGHKSENSESHSHNHNGHDHHPFSFHAPDFGTAIPRHFFALPEFSKNTILFSAILPSANGSLTGLSSEPIWYPPDNYLQPLSKTFETLKFRGPPGSKESSFSLI
jgi:hypothetical protein